MATRIIPANPANPGGRQRKTNVSRELIDDQYGGLRKYGPCPHVNPAKRIKTGGEWMRAVLGPDLGDGQVRGSKTNATSLDPTIALLNSHSTKTWVAGHLLNAEWGGSGIQNSNLTPLTSAANSAHETFEGHIKRMLVACRQIDQANGSLPHWYGVRYKVTVSNTQYANHPATNDMHSYAYSHISLRYKFVTLPKFPFGAAPHNAPPPPNTYNTVTMADPHYNRLTQVVVPVFQASPNIANWVPQPVKFSVDIHNEP